MSRLILFGGDLTLLPCPSLLLTGAELNLGQAQTVPFQRGSFGDQLRAGENEADVSRGAASRTQVHFSF